MQPERMTKEMNAGYGINKSNSPLPQFSYFSSMKPSGDGADNRGDTAGIECSEYVTECCC